MVKRVISKYADRFVSKWVILHYDIAVVYLTYVLANFVRHDFEYLSINPHVLDIQAIPVLLVYLFFFVVFRTYTGIIRHTSLMDTLLLFKASTASVFVLGLTSLFFRFSDYKVIFVPALSVVIIHFFMVPLFLVGSRFIIRSIYGEIVKRERKTVVNVLIYGAGSAGMFTRNALVQDATNNYEIVAFLDDNHSKVNKMLEGIPVLSREKALTEGYIKKNKIEQLILAIQNIDLNLKKEVIEKGLDLHLKVKSVPPLDTWINGRLSSSQLQEVRIEQLLERPPISINNDNIRRELHNKVIMVTGAAGSIGSEIARQILQYHPRRIILLDQAESALYELQFELKNDPQFRKYAHLAEFVIASVRDRFRMEDVFQKYKPQVIYHAAAYKHVPLMEENAYEALMVNVFGTKIIADLSVLNKVEKFVMVSTDKAVNPTNVMGASKRIAEIYTQSLSGGTTQFITTRFGNVLGSNGSVIPLFKKQIAAGGPVTVTHKDITRFFMTIPEACNLVLEAGAMGHGGEIFVFDMGKPMKIYDLAVKMIQLSGLEPHQDINILETGLRPGEKLYEELLANQENTCATHHPKIMIAKVRTNDKDVINNMISDLSVAAVEEDDFVLVKKMKQIVPEYISNNSVYVKLDKNA